MVYEPQKNYTVIQKEGGHPKRVQGVVALRVTILVPALQKRTIYDGAIITNMSTLARLLANKWANLKEFNCFSRFFGLCHQAVLPLIWLAKGHLCNS